jgi:ABC exporter DevB family membrane fusion protein
MKRTHRWIAGGVVLVGAIGLRVAWRPAEPLPVATTSVQTPAGDIVAAGPGRIEPVSEEIRVSAQLAGRIAEMMVEEGDTVQAGQPVAALEAADYAARVASAEADVRLRDAELRRLQNGARDEERREAAAGEAEADAALRQARQDLNRRRALFEAGVISAEDMDRASNDVALDSARLDAARERRALVDTTAREEDLTRAEAALAAARARLGEARALLAKTVVRSPLAGTVLRRHRHAGETVSTQFDSPIVTIADRSRLRVRVDVDENDVAKVRPGQRAYVTTDAYPRRRFYGRVVRVAQLLGKKNVRTDEPTERVDMKILETLIELEAADELPLGLRVQAFIEGGAGEDD